MSEERISPSEERFELWRRRAGWLLGPLLSLAVYLTAASLPAPERRLAAVLTLVIAFWISEAIPLPITAMLGPALCALLGVAEPAAVFRPFADRVIFLFVGSFLLARAMAVNGLDRRVALAVLSARAVGGSPARLRLAIGLTVFLLSMWISNTACAAMAFPIVVGMSVTLERLFAVEGASFARAGRSYITGLMLMVAYAASIGGLATPVGTPPNLIGMGMLRDLAGVRIPFLQWVLVGLPIALALFVLLATLLRFMHPAPTRKLDGLASSVDVLCKDLPPWGRAQTYTLLAFLVAVALWILPGVVALALGTDDAFYRLLSERLDEGVVAVLAASLLFFLPATFRPLSGALGWRDAVKIDWGTILLFGGGLSLGSLLQSTGLAQRVGQGLLQATGEPSVWLLTGVATGFAVLFTESASNTATATMLVPVTIAVANAAHVSPVPPVLGVTVGASLAFMLPVSTPPNAIVYGSGCVSLTAMLRTGVLLDLLGFVALMLLLRWLCPLLGLA
ncbi:MAG TPA: DASS family sodium-coupled anion symporter [Candidatus Xenobia bacterium]|nr:DASS family sodium-coupled anion symporter [Candidatus Xenobia bacterium]